MKWSFLIYLLMSHSTWSNVMDLNNYMPTQLEDAAPIDKGAWDLQLSSVQENTDHDVLLYRPNVRYGIWEEVQLEIQATMESGGSESRSGEMDVGLQYRFNKPEGYFPQVSLSPVVLMPTGKEMSSLDYSLKLDLTTTLRGTSKNPVTQVHFNSVYCKNNNSEFEERIDRYQHLFGFSHLLWPQTALVVDGVIEDELEQNVQSYLVEVGLHHHLKNDYYIGVGVGKGVGSSMIENLALLSFEKQFQK